MLNLSCYCIMSLCQGQMMGLVTKHCKRRNGCTKEEHMTAASAHTPTNSYPSKPFSIMGNYQCSGQMAELEWTYRHPKFRNTAYTCTFTSASPVLPVATPFSHG